MEPRRHDSSTADSRPHPAPHSPARRRWESPRLERTPIDTTQNTPGALSDGITTSSLVP